MFKKIINLIISIYAPKGGFPYELRVRMWRGVIQDYVCFEYRLPSGFWRYVKGVTVDVPDFCIKYTMRPVLYRANYWREQSFKAERLRWDTLAKVQQFHAEQRAIMQQKNAAIKM